MPHGNVIDKEKDLPLLLDNLARQTGLQFKVERRTTPMSVVDARNIQDEQRREKLLRTILDHVTEQTELQFEIRKEMFPVWHVTKIPPRDASGRSSERNHNHAGGAG